MNTSKFRITILLTILVFLALGVKGSVSAKSKSIDIEIPYIDKNINMLYVNQGGWLSGSRTGEYQLELKWTTSDPSVLKLYSEPKESRDCVFVAEKAGDVTVTATDKSGYKEKIKITVAEKAPEGIFLGKQKITSKGESAVLYYKAFRFNNNQKLASGVLVAEAGKFCVSLGGRLHESITDNYIRYISDELQDALGSWNISFSSRGFSVDARNTYNIAYLANGYYDDKKNFILAGANYKGIYMMNNKDYHIDQSYTIENGWRFNKYKLYNNRQLFVRYACYELIKITGSIGDTIPDIDNYTLNYYRAETFRSDFENFNMAQYYGINKNVNAKYGEDTSKTALVVKEDSELALALEKYCGVASVDELPVIMPVDQKFYYWPDLSVGKFNNYYVITTGEKAGEIVYEGDDGSGVKDEHGVIWFGSNISI